MRQNIDRFAVILAKRTGVSYIDVLDIDVADPPSVGDGYKGRVVTSVERHPLVDAYIVTADFDPYRPWTIIDCVMPPSVYALESQRNRDWESSRAKFIEKAEYLLSVFPRRPTRKQAARWHAEMHAAIAEWKQYGLTEPVQFSIERSNLSPHDTYSWGGYQKDGRLFPAH